MKNKQQGSATLAGLIIIGLWLAFVVGWVINIVEVIQLAVANAPLTTLFVLKVVGIVLAPMGALLGLFF